MRIGYLGNDSVFWLRARAEYTRSLVIPGTGWGNQRTMLDYDRQATERTRGGAPGCRGRRDRTENRQQADSAREQPDRSASNILPDEQDARG